MKNSERNEQSPDQNIGKLKELIRGIKVVMLTTLNEDGTFHSRPMWSQQQEFDGELWFFTHTNASKAQELRKDSHVTLNFMDEDNNCYVAVYGRGSVVQDRAKAEKFWNPTMGAVFPQGVDDPSLALLRVQVERAEYWDSPSGLKSQVVKFVKDLTADKREAA